MNFEEKVQRLYEWKNKKIEETVLRIKTGTSTYFLHPDMLLLNNSTILYPNNYTINDNIIVLGEFQGDSPLETFEECTLQFLKDGILHNEVCSLIELSACKQIRKEPYAVWAYDAGVTFEIWEQMFSQGTADKIVFSADIVGGVGYESLGHVTKNMYIPTKQLKGDGSGPARS